MGRHLLRTASEHEIVRLWPAVRAGHLFSSIDDLEAVWRAAPWRVQVSEAGDAAVLRPWRAHLSALAISALWCPASHVSRALGDLVRLARDQGYGHLLSPLVAEELVGQYTRAGMSECERIVTFRMDGRSALDWTPTSVSGVRFRPARADDISDILALDAECFDEFWRYGPEELAEYFVRDRTVVAEGEDGLIGYTLCTVENGAGTLGRLAVSPAQRGRGVGTALARDAIGYMARNGAGIVSLCTQEHNSASRAVYARVGMREIPDRLHLLWVETDR